MDLSKKPRKKLKTRKYRDILKRKCIGISKQNCFLETNPRTSGVRVGSNMGSMSDCLTLKDFRRSLKSETITRHSLGKIKLQKSKSQKRIKLKSHVCDNNSSMLTGNDDNAVTHDVSSKDFLLFSPLYLRKKVEFSCNKKHELFSSNYKEFTKCNCNCEELITTISLYLDEQFPDLASEDVMADDKKKLQELYYEYCHKTYTNNVSKSMWSNNSTSYSYKARGMSETFGTGNTMESLSVPIGQNFEDSCGSSYSNCTQSLYNPVAYPSSPRDPAGHYDITNIYDSPEYNFYPHKLK